MQEIIPVELEASQSVTSVRHGGNQRVDDFSSGRDSFSVFRGSRSRTGEDLRRLARIGANGGVHPMWRGDGRELFYLGGGNRVATVMRVEVNAESSGFHAGVPAPVFEHRIIGLLHARTNYAMAPDSQRVLLRRPAWIRRRSLSSPAGRPRWRVRASDLPEWAKGLQSRRARPRPSIASLPELRGAPAPPAD